MDSSSFFQKKFIDCYDIDIHSIEDLLLDELTSDEILALSLSDSESHIILSSTVDEKFQEETIENSKIVFRIVNNTKLLKSGDEFVECMVTTYLHIESSKYIAWKRNLLLYIIFDAQKTNLALAHNKIEDIAKNIKNLLNHN